MKTYSPRIGRWLVPDPAGQGFSPYVYCGNNPLMFVDPDGAFFAELWTIYSLGKMAYSMYKSYQSEGVRGLFSSFVQGTISWGAGQVIGGHLTGITGVGLRGWKYAGYSASIAGGMGQYGGSSFIQSHLQGKTGQEVWSSTWKNAVFGGVSHGTFYHFSNEFQWQTHEKVLNWAEKYNNLTNAAQYVAGIEGSYAAFFVPKFLNWNTFQKILSFSRNQVEFTL